MADMFVTLGTWNWLIFGFILMALELTAPGVFLFWLGLAALLVGAMFGLWLILNPAGLAAGVYITLQQQAIRTLNRVMPVLGATGSVVVAYTVPSEIFRYLVSGPPANA